MRRDHYPWRKCLTPGCGFKTLNRCGHCGFCHADPLRCTHEAGTAGQTAPTAARGVKWIKALANGFYWAHMIDHYAGDRCILRGFRRLP